MRRGNNVLQRAKDESNPMHPLFEWDDSVAANNYRLHQASVLICNLKAEVQNDTKPKTVRAYFNVSDDEKQGKFINVNAAFENPDTKDIVLKRALRELQTFQKKYETLSEFSMLFEQINQLSLMFEKGG